MKGLIGILLIIISFGWSYLAIDSYYQMNNLLNKIKIIEPSLIIKSPIYFGVVLFLLSMSAITFSLGLLMLKEDRTEALKEIKKD